MTRWILSFALAVALASVPGCGEETGDLAVGLEVRLSALTGEETLQFTVLHDRDRSGAEVSCPEVTGTCIGDQSRLRPVPLETSSGTQCAHRAPLDLDQAQTTDGQPVSIPGIPPGRNYLVVVEVVRDGAGGEQRVGAGCIPVEQIVRGTNRPPTTAIDVLDVGGGCNPAVVSC
jgi:hypothetical protein